MGDSKTAAKPWNDQLTANLRAATGRTWSYDNAGVVGATVGSTLTNIAAALALSVHMPLAVLINLGVNDFAAMPAEATWEANYESILDQVNAKWPNAIIYLSYPWMVGQDANAATMHSWINVIQAARSAFVRTADDEAIWLKGSDNGASETVDGVHYSTLGNTLKATQSQTVLGF